MNRLLAPLSCLYVLLVTTPTLFAVDLLESGEQPLDAEEAAKTMVVPDGFRVTLFAGEPHVKQPIGFCVDDRGRLWVAEAYNYPKHGTKAGDRIVILDDTDGDGKFDKRTVFYDKLNYVTGIEVGFGGAWVMSPPNFYFIPDRDGDDVPDSEPRVLLDGFGTHANAHNLANGFAWGPDGWLYGTHGRTNWSMVGKPRTKDEHRRRFDGGVYRYHPTRHAWEPYADGTTNPWGIDWNDYGEAFITNCVNPHLFHVVEGAHYEPWRNRKSSQYAFERIPTIADHLHFVGTANERDGIGSAAEDTAGGGHAHCGTLIYLGDNWPARYRNTLFTNNIHGRRINNDILRRHGSSYLAAHGRDVMLSRDPWFMGVTLQAGPAGEVYASDWSDTGECHSTRNTRRHTGRIYRISYGDLQRPQTNITKLSLDELVVLQVHDNDWQVRHARRVLQEKAAAGETMNDVHAKLRTMLNDVSATPKKLRALWALHVTDGFTNKLLVRLLDHDDEFVRAWAIRLLCEDRRPPQQAMTKFVTLAKQGDSQLVRLHLASVMQRLELPDRWDVLEALASRQEDADDASLPLMLWYAVEPLMGDDLERYIKLAAVSRVPILTRHIARRVAGDKEASDGLEHLCDAIAESTRAEIQTALLRGMLRGLEGRRSVSQPKSWPRAYQATHASDVDAIASASIQLALKFNDESALRQLRSQALDRTQPPIVRNRALAALIRKRSDELATTLLKLIDDEVVQGTAIRGLASFNDSRIPRVLLERFTTFSKSSQADAMQTLASRSAWATAMLSALERKRLGDARLNAFTARQLQSLGDEKVTEQVKRLWGEVRTSSRDRQRVIAKYKARLTPQTLAKAELPRGRAVFQKHCAKCHKLFDAGGKVGPDLTGAQRMNLDYVLENLIDPSAAVSKDYQTRVIHTREGRVITGLVTAETNNALTIATLNDVVVVPRNEIAAEKTSATSMMPDGLLKSLTNTEVRDLIGYLQSTRQIALRDTPH